MPFAIEDDVQLPVGAQSKYPFGSMSVGQSFFVSDVPAQKVANAASSFARRHGVKFTYRTVTEGGVQGARFWRVS